MHWYDRDRRKIFKFGGVRLGVRVLSFHNFGNLGSQLKTKYDAALGKKWKSDLYHKRNTTIITKGVKNNFLKLTLTPSPPFSFLDYLLGKGGVKKCTVHPWHATGVSLPGQRFGSHMRPASMT